MAENSLRQWLTTPASNTDVGGVTLVENVMKPSDVNNAVRAMMGQTAQYLVEMSYPTAGGTANALTLTPTTALAALTANQAYTFNAASANSTAATLAVSGLTAKAIRKIVGGTDVALAANDIQANGRYTVVYDTTANAAAGAWILTAVSTAGTLNQLVVRVQVFTSSGTYTPNANMVYCQMLAQGAGGGGGGAQGAVGGVCIGAGGGAGSYSITISSKATIGASQTVTIGAAGTGATAGATGSTGGDSSVGTLCIGKGGGGGQPSTGGSISAFVGGRGGVVGTGDIITVGALGVGGFSATILTVYNFLGSGASSIFGEGGLSTFNGTGAAASGRGAGGGGGGQSNAATNRAGGDGGAGYIYIIEYCSA